MGPPPPSPPYVLALPFCRQPWHNRLLLFRVDTSTSYKRLGPPLLYQVETSLRFCSRFFRACPAAVRGAPDLLANVPPAHRSRRSSRVLCCFSAQAIFGFGSPISSRRGSVIPIRAPRTCEYVLLLAFFCNLDSLSAAG